MRAFARRLVLFLAALALVAGLPLALAIPPVLAAEACPHEHHDMTAGDANHQKPHHRHDLAACLCCCMGTCVGVPDLPRSSVVVVPLATAAVVYPENAVSLDGRSLRPDPAPPRSSALS